MQKIAYYATITKTLITIRLIINLIKFIIKKEILVSNNIKWIRIKNIIIKWSNWEKKILNGIEFSKKSDSKKRRKKKKIELKFINIRIWCKNY